MVLDVRFQSGSINTGVSQLLKQETGVGKTDFTDITDYVVLLVYLMRRMGFTKTECKQLIAGYEAIVERYRAELPSTCSRGSSKPQQGANFPLSAGL